MRITGGFHRSRKLETPKGDAVRPTSDKVRQAIFNMLNGYDAVRDATVIDAFCGTGALGLEALSQGAAYCTFFDKSKASIELCGANIQILKEDSRTFLLQCDATKPKERPEGTAPATLVFLDPPYHKELIPKAIDGLIAANWVAAECYWVIEMAKDESFSHPNINILTEKNYGDTNLIIALSDNA